MLRSLSQIVSQSDLLADANLWRLCAIKPAAQYILIRIKPGPKTLASLDNKWGGIDAQHIAALPNPDRNRGCRDRRRTGFIDSDLFGITPCRLHWSVGSHRDPLGHELMLAI